MEVQEHLARYHRTASRTANFGWHLHFVALREFLRGGGCPVPADADPQSPDEMPVVPTLDAGQSVASMNLAGPPSAFGEWLSGSSASDFNADTANRQNSERSDFAVPTNRRLPLLCIARC